MMTEFLSKAPSYSLEGVFEWINNRSSRRSPRSHNTGDFVLDNINHLLYNSVTKIEKQMGEEEKKRVKRIQKTTSRG